MAGQGGELPFGLRVTAGVTLWLRNNQPVDRMLRGSVFRRILMVCWFAPAILLALALPAYARLFHVPSYDELFAKSDLVVIAHPVTKTAATRERTFFPGIVEGDGLKVAAVGVETTFEIREIVKGRRDHRQFVLHHLQMADTRPTLNGPGTLSFDPAGYEDFLMFLVKQKDGRYAPYTGQVDPELSIFAFRGLPFFKPTSAAGK